MTRAPRPSSRIESRTRRHSLGPAEQRHAPDGLTIYPARRRVAKVARWSGSPSHDDAGRYAPDGPYALARLALSLLIATLVGAGMWAVIVVLPQAQLDFGVDRAAASLPYTLMMCGLAFGTIVWGRMADRRGFAAPLALSSAILGLGFVGAG